MAKPLVVTRDSAPKSLNVVGEQITILASGAQTNSYEIFLQAGPEGSGPPPHSHDWDEAFYIIRGEVDFGIADKQMTALPGTLVHLPAGTSHWFRFKKGGAEMVSMTSREGASHLFTDIDREIAPDKPDFEKLIRVGTQHGLTITPPKA